MTELTEDSSKMRGFIDTHNSMSRVDDIQNQVDVWKNELTQLCVEIKETNAKLKDKYIAIFDEEMAKYYLREEEEDKSTDEDDDEERIDEDDDSASRQELKECLEGNHFDL